MAISEPERATALHGLVLWVNWRPLRRTPESVALGFVLHPQPGYPFTLALEVSYVLADSGLEVGLQATNVRAEPAPVGLGFHPAFTVGDPRIDQTRLEIPAREEPLVTLWMDAGFDYLQAYTCDVVPDPSQRRHGITLEPMTCAPDAFNSGEGLRILEPGEAFAARCGLVS